MNNNFTDLKLVIPNEEGGQRLDSALAAISTLSRRRLQKAIDEGGVYINKKRCRKAGRIIQGGEKVRIVMLDNEKLVPFSEEQVVWADKSWILIHKKEGQYAQEALHRTKGTLPYEIGLALKLSPVDAKLLRPVHRLDKGTSGLMMFSYNPKALQHLQQAWAKAVDKVYYAVVSPAPDWDELNIDSSISVQPDKAGRYHIHPKGRISKTDATVLERKDGRALIRLVPHTGRTHQLRVHLASVGTPILGDARYGGKSFHRLMLHASELKIKGYAMKTKETQWSWLVEPAEDWKW